MSLLIDIVPTVSIWTAILKVQCNECYRWIHAECEGMDEAQYIAVSEHAHPIWVRT